jgi:hypothetical protein
MSGPLKHPPATVVRQMLVDMALGIDGDGRWQTFAAREPDSPDEVITVYDTAGRDLGRDMVTQERIEVYGVQVRVRSVDYESGWSKCKSVADAMDGVYRRPVTVDGVGYIVGHISRSSQVLSIGVDAPASGRRLFTVNGTVLVWMV